MAIHFCSKPNQKPSRVNASIVSYSSFYNWWQMVLQWISCSILRGSMLFIFSHIYHRTCPGCWGRLVSTRTWSRCHKTPSFLSCRSGLFLSRVLNTSSAALSMLPALKTVFNSFSVTQPSWLVSTASYQALFNFWSNVSSPLSFLALSAIANAARPLRKSSLVTCLPGTIPMQHNTRQS